MKKVIAVVAIGLSGCFGAGLVNANEDTGAELIVDYKRDQNLVGSNADQMMMRAWMCYTNTLSVMEGAEFKEKGFSLDKVKTDLAMDEPYLSLFSKGYEYEKPTDIAIGALHAQCLIDAHKQITSK